MAAITKIVAGPSVARLVEGVPRILYRKLAVKDPKACYDASFNSKLWDGKEHFFDITTRTFPSGLVWRACRILRKRGFEVEVEWEQKPKKLPPVLADCLWGKTLRDYQVESVNVALERGRGIFDHATGAGKTVEIAALVGHLFREAGIRSLVVVPTVDLCTQTSANLQELLGEDIRVGSIGAGRRQTKADVYVATYQTLTQALPAKHKFDKKTKQYRASRRHDPKLKGVIDKCQCVVIDEAHHTSSSSYMELLAISPALYRFGFTGTVDRGSEKKIEKWRVEGALGPVVHSVKTRQLVAAGVLAKPTIYVIADDHAFGPTINEFAIAPPDQVKSGKINKWKAVFDAGILGNSSYHKTIAYITKTLLSQGKPPLIISARVAHLRVLRRVFNRSGIPHRVLHGAHAVQHRDDTKKDFARDQNFALLASSIFDEGVDVPEIRAVVLAGAGKSVVQICQRIGRGLRRKAADNRLAVIDFSHCHSNLLAGHYEKRCAIYSKQGFRVVKVNTLAEVNGIDF